jgi:DNA adenine methylase
MSNTLFDREPEMKVTALAPWAGSNRMLAPIVGNELGKLNWCGVVFAGGMSEVPHIQSREILVNDLHRDIINLARVVAMPEGKEFIKREADKCTFHPDDLARSQGLCRNPIWDDKEGPDVLRALWYFVAVWMGRSAMAGTDGEFDGNISARFTASGGGSNVRFRSAIESLDAWHQTLRRCEFTVRDFRKFLDSCHDRDGHGIYSDAPFPVAGGMYIHKFTDADQCALAESLGRFKKARVVIRFYDHPLIRKLYPEPRWTWRRLKGRDQANNPEKEEVLIINGQSYA